MRSVFKISNLFYWVILAAGFLFLPELVSAQASLGLGDATATGLGTRDLRELIVFIIQIFLGFLGIIAVALMLYGGFVWMTAGGNEDKIGQAKKILINAGIGLVIILSAFTIVTFIIKAISDATGTGGDGDTGGGGDNPPGFFAENFRPTSIQPQGQLPIRNIVVQVTFNKQVDPESLINYPDGLRVEKMNVSGQFEEVQGKLTMDQNNPKKVLFTPLSPCPAPNENLFCFDYNQENEDLNRHRVIIDGTEAGSLKSLNKESVTCAVDACQAEFITGALVDVSDPEAELIQAIDSLGGETLLTDNVYLSLEELYEILAEATDDSGITGVDFYFDGDFFDADQPTGQPPLSFEAFGSLDTGAFIAGQYDLSVIAYDLALNSSQADEIAINLAPNFCFNNVFEPGLGETGLDCGGQCPACDDITPTIISVTPDNGAPGNWLTIYGQNFGNQPGTIRIGDKEAVLPPADICEASWQATQIIVELPELEIGNHQLSLETADGLISNFVDILINETLRPGICLLEPVKGQFEDEFIVKGVQFGSDINDRTVYFGLPDNPFTADNISWQNFNTYDQVTAQVPNLTEGQNAVKVKVDNEDSNPLLFQVQSSENQAIVINYFTPDKGATDQFVTIIGSGFGNYDPENSKVQFTPETGSELRDGSFDFPDQCGTDFWTDNQIVVKVPDPEETGGLGEGPLTVIRADGQKAISAEDFVYSPSMAVTPGICSLYPNEGLAGSFFEIAGEGFENSGLYLNQSLLSDEPENNNYYGQVEVPIGAQSGPVKVINNDGEESNTLDFAVLAGQAGDNPIPADYYQWQFTTCENCLAPEVVEYGFCDDQSLASPTPLNDSEDNFIDTHLALTFSTAMDPDSFLLNQNVIVQKCGNGDDPANCTTVLVNGLGEHYPSGYGYETYVLDFINNLLPNTWYRVGILDSVTSQEGFALAEPYSWDFKTRVTSELCSVDTVNVLPANRIVDEFFPQYNDPVYLGEEVLYSSHAYNEETCNICPADFEWQWQSSEPANANINELSVINQSLLSADGLTTPAVHAIITAIANATSSPSDTAVLDIVPPNPQLVYDQACQPDFQTPSPWPGTQTACVNVIISAQFDQLMDPVSTLDSGNITVRVENVDGGWTVLDGSIEGLYGERNGLNGLIGFTYNPVSDLEADKWHEVSLSEQIISELGAGLSGNRSWQFKTRNSNEPCVFTQVNVDPSSSIINVIPQTETYTAIPIGENCEILDPELNLNWSWYSEDQTIAEVTSQTDDVAVVTSASEGVTHIRATANGISNQGENGRLTVGLGDGPLQLEIIENQPVGNDVCINSLGRLRFNLNLNNESVNSENFELWQNKDGWQKVEDFSLTSNFQYNIINILPNTDNNLWDEFSEYSIKTQGGPNGIIAMTGETLTENGCPTDMIWDNSEESCAWNFTVGEDVCEVAEVGIEPAVAISTVDSITNWTATPYDDFGTALSNWLDRWQIENIWQLQGMQVATIATTTPSGRDAESLGLTIGQARVWASTPVADDPDERIWGSSLLNVNEEQTGPTVTSVKPADQAEDVCRNALIEVEFDKKINVQKVTSETFKLEYLSEENLTGCYPSTQQGSFNVGFDNFSSNIFARIINWLSGSLLDRIISSVNAAQGDVADENMFWCPISGSRQVNNTSVASKIKFVINEALPPTASFRLQIKGGSEGILGLNGLALTGENLDDGDFTSSFSTRTDVCQLSFVNVTANEDTDTNEWIFTSSFDNSDDNDPEDQVSFDTIYDSDKKYTATGFSQDGQALTSIPGVYEWNWQWSSQVGNIAQVVLVENDFSVVAAQNTSGEAEIQASAVFPDWYIRPSVNGSGLAIVDLCENPWPARVSEEPNYYPDEVFNFALSYCRDAGGSGTADDLPAIVMPEAQTGVYELHDGKDDLFKEYLISVPTTNDLIGIRVYENSFHLSADDWYRKNIANQGNLQSLTVDGYPAVRDGRTVYIAFTNHFPLTGQTETPLILLSYNQEADQKTQNIVNQLVERIKFNSNIVNPELKAKVIRDFQRIRDLNKMAGNLQNYYLQNQSYPDLEAGSYLKGMSVSKWPSWNQTLAAELGVGLPSDPINEFGACTACQQPNLPNRGFESPTLENWIVDQDVNYIISNENVREGVNSLLLSATSSFQGIHQPLNLLPNTTYNMSAWVYIEEGQAELTFAGYDDGNQWFSQPDQTGWVKLTNKLVTNAGGQGSPWQNNPNNGIYIRSHDGPAVFYVDQVVLEIAENCGYDINTCWNPEANSGNGAFACDADSYFYKYQSFLNNNGLADNYNLDAKFEAVEFNDWYPANNNNHKYINEHIQISLTNVDVCTNQTYSGYCGDGIINAGEQCEPGMSYDFCTEQDWHNEGLYGCGLPGTPFECEWYDPILAGDCASESECCGGYCGNGVLEDVEECDYDLGGGGQGWGGGTSENDQYGCSIQCLDAGGWCGDNIKNGPEVCDGTNSPTNSTCAGSCNSFSCNAGFDLINGHCAPDQPTNFNADSISNSQINLNWIASPMATSYKIKKTDVPDPEACPATWELYPNQTSTAFSSPSIQSGLTLGTSYCFAIKACISNNCSNMVSDSATTSDTEPVLPDLTLESFTAVTDAVLPAEQINLSWVDAPTGHNFVIKYAIREIEQACPSPNNVFLYNATTVGTFTSPVTSAVHSGLEANKKYCYAIRENDGQGNYMEQEDILGASAETSNDDIVESTFIFVTPGTYPGNFGGLAYADGECDSIASLNGFDGTWKAWLSNDTISAYNRLGLEDLPEKNDFRLVDDNNTIIAYNKTDFLDGTLLSPINIKPDGQPIASPVNVFTGTTASGNNIIDSNCANWTDTQSFGAIGWANRIDYNWSLADNQGLCGNTPQTQARFYCISTDNINLQTNYNNPD